MGWLTFTWRQIYLFWIGPILLGIVFIYFVRSGPSKAEDVGERNEQSDVGDVKSLLTRDFLLYISSRGIRMFAMSMVGPFISIYLTEVRGWMVSEIGVMFGVGSLLGLVASPVGRFMASRLDEKRWTVFSFAIGYACFLAAFFTSSIPAFVALYLTYRVCGILSMPAMGAITAWLSPPNQMGMGFALSFMPSSITGIVAPIVAAWIADTFGLFPIFIVATGVMYMSLILLQLGVRVK